MYRADYVLLLTSWLYITTSLGARDACEDGRFSSNLFSPLSDISTNQPDIFIQVLAYRNSLISLVDIVAGLVFISMCPER